MKYEVHGKQLSEQEARDMFQEVFGRKDLTFGCQIQMTQTHYSEYCNLYRGETHRVGSDSVTMTSLLAFDNRKQKYKIIGHPVTLDRIVEVLAEKCKNLVAYKIHPDTGDTFIYADNNTIMGWGIGKTADQQGVGVLCELLDVMDTL